jgi:hypothetical protein
MRSTVVIILVQCGMWYQCLRTGDVIVFVAILWKLRRAQQQYQAYCVVHSTVSILILTTICAKLSQSSTRWSLLTMDDKGDDEVAHGQQKISTLVTKYGLHHIRLQVHN